MVWVEWFGVNAFLVTEVTPNAHCGAKRAPMAAACFVAPNFGRQSKDKTPPFSQRTGAHQEHRRVVGQGGTLGGAHSTRVLKHSIPLSPTNLLLENGFERPARENF